ncbi:MAG: hypothetical protein FD123_2462 [Bacteroidetes bacterium]|nr:MAG: hypothetical protein FD123_2462 [Bacteroidota bacterium]
MLKKYHYLDMDQGSEISYGVFGLFMESLDPSGMLFLQSDVDELGKYKLELFSQKSACRFAELAATRYQAALKRADSLIAVISAQPFDLKLRDSLQPKKAGKITYSADAASLGKRWARRIRYVAMRQLFTSGEKIASAAEYKKQLTEKESALRSKAALTEKNKIARLQKPRYGMEHEIGFRLLNAFAARYDPHSEVYSKEELQNFRDALSPENLTYGLSFEEDNEGLFTVSALLPGGPAWRCGQLHKGDLLIHVSTSGGMKIETMEYDEEVLNAWMNTEALAMHTIELTLRKKDGQQVTVSLSPEKIRQDNTVKSYLLKGPDKIGYISLPSFYTDDESPQALGCANDVAREITKLQEEGIQGLVLDLRYNGGGSVREALGLAGIFIDEGPLCIYKGRSGKPLLMKDLNRGKIYGGPLIVLVNGLSASASEILSAALSDYNRAVILGSSTYGKATGQVAGRRRKQQERALCKNDARTILPPR